MKFLLFFYRYIKLIFLLSKYNLMYFFSLGFLHQFDFKNYDTLIITHNLGGGTLHFEKNYFEKVTKKYLRVSVISYGIDILYVLESPLLKKKCFLRRNQILKVFEGNYKYIMLNSLITYKNISKIFQCIINYKMKHKDCILTYFVHDYHSICPEYNLISNGNFCELKCEHCKQSFNVFAYDTNQSVIEWRQMWDNLFSFADEIRCFSYSSKNFIISSYGNNLNQKITVVPHDISYINSKPISNELNKQFHLGIIGTCQTIAKGRNVVNNILKNEEFTFPISIVGSPKKSFLVKKSNINYYGFYKRDSLRDVIVAEKITCILFPAIWPETFSYLVSELLALNLPIICFDVGSQSEKIKNYSKGIVVKNEQELFNYLKNCNKRTNLYDINSDDNI